jgi:hypothetical protein
MRQRLRWLVSTVFVVAIVIGCAAPLPPEGPEAPEAPQVPEGPEGAGRWDAAVWDASIWGP